MDNSLILEENLVKIAENAPKVYESGYKVGFEEGKQAEYDAFWDDYLNGDDFTNAFGRRWTPSTFLPNRDIIPQKAYMIFCNSAMVIDLVEHLDKLNVTLDFSKATNTQYLFSGSKFTRVGVIDVRSSINSVPLENAFNNCTNIVTIEKIYLKTGRIGEFNYTFNNCINLENVTFEGEINSNGLDLHWSAKLSKASITNIINCLSTTTSGLTVTLPKTAVNNAFGIDVDDASTYPEGSEYYNLRNSKSNWTFNYA